VPREKLAAVVFPFWSFRIMVGMGLLMAGPSCSASSCASACFMTPARCTCRGREAVGLHRGARRLITTETGRQPSLVYGLLRTADAASPLAAPAVASSLIAFVIVYFTVFTAGVVYILRMMAEPPHHGETGPGKDVPARAGGPAGAVTGAIR
jgi:cytochrome d ubiquinol oxidase subunit I